MPSRWVGGICSPRKFLRALRLLLAASGGWKLTTNKLLNVKKNINFTSIWGGGGDPGAPLL